MRYRSHWSTSSKPTILSFTPVWTAKLAVTNNAPGSCSWSTCAAPRSGKPINSAKSSVKKKNKLAGVEKNSNVAKIFAAVAALVGDQLETIPWDLRPLHHLLHPPTATTAVSNSVTTDDDTALPIDPAVTTAQTEQDESKGPRRVNLSTKVAQDRCTVDECPANQ